MQQDKERDHRIEMEIVVDCYSSDEQFSGWHAYLDDVLKFPFEGFWQTTEDGKREKVKVIGLSDFDDCEDIMDILVEIEYEGEEISEPLSEIFDIQSDDEKTKETVEDWHYWVESGNGFDEYEDEEDEY